MSPDAGLRAGVRQGSAHGKALGSGGVQRPPLYPALALPSDEVHSRESLLFLI